MAGSAQQVLPGGTEILNEAQALFVTPENIEGRDTLVSNRVKATIEINPSIELLDDQNKLSLSGESVSIEHTLSNTGNVPVTAEMELLNTEDDNFDFESLTVEFEQISQQEKSVQNATGSVLIAPGESYRLTASAKIPATALRDEFGIFTVNVNVPEFDISIQNTDTVLILAATEMALTKRIVTPDAVQGDILGYEIETTNTGDVTALDIPVLVDGLTERYVLLEDVIPANTTFHSFAEMDAEITPLIHVIGMQEQAYLSEAPEDLSQVDKIAFGMPEVEANVTYMMAFNVRINDNASGDIENVAKVTYDNGLGQQVVDEVSNLVTSLLPAYEANIFFYTDNSFTNKTKTGNVGAPLFLQADAAGCNINGAIVDSTNILLTSDLTGDMEQLLGIETGPNTGVFRVLPEVPTRDYKEHPVETFNRILETTENDKLIAELEECSAQGQSAEIVAEVTVNPRGVLFNSESNQPISGTKVSLFKVENDGTLTPANVRGFNGNETLSSEVLTNNLGEFRFPFLAPGRYKIEVETPNTYNYPSALSPMQLPSGRRINDEGSYGEIFEITNANGPVDFDIPLDISGVGAMKLEKEVNRTEVEVGEYVTYAISVTNLIQQTITGVQIEDEIPFGFSFIEGSAALNDSTVNDPVGSPGPVLRFGIDSLQIGESTTLTYKLKAGPASLKSDGINTAIATANELIEKLSNTAKVKVEVRGGVFSDESYVIGKVFYDKNKNRVQDFWEPGIPGVRLYLENGTFVVTDVAGRYSLYGVSPRMHVLKMDLTTLPEGGVPLVLDNRHANDASSRFVDVHKGELHKADFAICGCEGDIMPEVQMRRERALAPSFEMQNTIEDRLKLDSQKYRPDAKAGPSKGIVNGDKKSFEGVAEDQDGVTEEDQPILQPTEMEQEDRLVVSDWPSLEKVLNPEETFLGFVDIMQGDTLMKNNTTIRVKGPLGSKFRLYINGEQLSATRIGRQAEYGQISIWEYVGSNLKAGINELALSQYDPFGNRRDSLAIVITAPGEFSSFKIERTKNHVPADGESYAELTIKPVDKKGVPVYARLPVTLDIESGQIMVDDLMADDPGVQTFINGAPLKIKIRTPQEAQKSKFKVSSGTVEEQAELTFIPNLRPLIAAGIIQGTLRLRGGLSVNPVTRDDGFERELQSLAYHNGGFTADARTAFFIKGKVLGEYLLTASFDSEKAEEEEMFRDIRPDEFYPVYGDASIRGFDAQSSGRLFVKLEKNQTYALIGDFGTQENRQNVKLGSYNRYLNGVKTHFENDRVTADVFGSQSGSKLVIDELAALGISGPYVVSEAPMIRNSERVEIVTRDRNQSSLIINREPLTRWVDYSIEPFSGQMIFNAPVRSYDENLNPRFIRVSYESEDITQTYFTGGANTQLKITDAVEVGGTVISDPNPERDFKMASGNTSVKIGQNTTVTGEFAGTDDEQEGTGMAGRLEMRHRGATVDGRIYAGRSSESFYNPFSTLGQARTEAGMKGSVNLGNKTAIQAEAIHSRNDTTNTGRDGVMLNVQKGFGDIQALAGMRYSRESTQQNEEIENVTLRSRLTSTIPFWRKGQIFGEYEQSISDVSRKIAAIGTDARIGSIGKFYARHEFISSMGNQYGLNNGQQQNSTVVGLESNYMNNGSVFSEYRVRDAIDGRQAQASIGLRNQFNITEGFGVQTSFERVHTVQGTAMNEGTAMSLGASYTGAETWKLSGRGEARFSERGDVYLNSLGYGLRLTNNWAFLARHIFSLQTRGGGKNRLQERLQAGFAFRDYTASRWNALTRYEFKYEDNQQSDIGLKRNVHVVSAHVNYQFNDDVILSGRAATKASFEDAGNGNTDLLNMNLLAGRLTYDITKKWDLGTSAAVLSDGAFESADYRIGAEAGFIAATNLRMAAGYNFSGYYDPDLPAFDYTQQGPYIGMSYKFDEYTIKGLFNDDQPSARERFICIPCEPVLVKPNWMTLSLPDLDVPEILDITAPAPFFMPDRIHFALARHYISLRSAALLDYVSTYLRRMPNEPIHALGNTDSRNTLSYNFRLSTRRAEATKAYLIGSGISPDRIMTEARGEENLLREDDEQDIIRQAENRRVSFDFERKPAMARFLKTIEDIQVSKVEFNYYTTYNYLLTTNYEALPNMLQFEAQSFIFSSVTRKTLERMALSLEWNPEKSLTIQAEAGNPDSENRLNALAAFFADRIDTSRINFELTEENVVDGPFGHRLVRVTSDDTWVMIDVEPRPDQILDRELETIEYITSLQNRREDYQMLNEPEMNTHVPRQVHFAYAKAEIGHKTTGFLSRVARYMEQHPEATVMLTAETDPKSKQGKNDVVAKQRAQNVKEYLVLRGIAADRIKTEININTDNSAGNDEWKLAEMRKVTINMQSESEVQYVNQDYDLKPRPWMVELDEKENGNQKTEEEK